VLTGPQVILTLKIAVLLATSVLLASLVALSRGRYWLHGRINLVFFALCVAAVGGLELTVRIVNPQLFDYFDDATRQGLATHLTFSVPATALLPLMVFTGLTHRRTVHLALAAVFSVLWCGTVVTGIVYLK
jgi:hypothetical protein